LNQEVAQLQRPVSPVVLPSVVVLSDVVSAAVVVVHIQVGIPVGVVSDVVVDIVQLVQVAQEDTATSDTAPLVDADTDVHKVQAAH
jgi:hypothetical protein